MGYHPKQIRLLLEDGAKHNTIIQSDMESEDTVAAVAATTPLLENDDSANVVDVHDRREDLIRISSMIGLVLLGLVFVIIVFFWPLIFASLIFPHTIILWAAPMAEVIHFCSLVWIPYPYLYIHRKTLYPLRRLLMPLVNQISKSESIREKESTWYNKCSELPRTRDAKELLTHFKMSVRKDLKKKLKLFFQHNITTETFHGDYLSLRQDIPIMWEHEKRTVRGTDKSVVEEFVKRFLVVFLVTNAYIDRYYDGEGNMCALGLFVASKNTLNNFLYFCLEKERLSGIWQCKYSCS